jgi:hypothetical protein
MNEETPEWICKIVTQPFAVNRAFLGLHIGRTASNSALAWIGLGLSVGTMNSYYMDGVLNDDRDRPQSRSGTGSARACSVSANGRCHAHGRMRCARSAEHPKLFVRREFFRHQKQILLNCYKHKPGNQYRAAMSPAPTTAAAAEMAEAPSV